MLNNIVDNYEQCWQQNIVASCFQPVKVKGGMAYGMAHGMACGMACGMAWECKFGDFFSRQFKTSGIFYRDKNAHNAVYRSALSQQFPYPRFYRGRVVGNETTINF